MKKFLYSIYLKINKKKAEEIKQKEKEMNEWLEVWAN